MATNLPFTVQALISNSTSVAQPHDGSSASAVSSPSRFRAPSIQVPKFESRKKAGGVCSWPYSLSVEGCLLSVVAQKGVSFCVTEPCSSCSGSIRIKQCLILCGSECYLIARGGCVFSALV